MGKTLTIEYDKASDSLYIYSVQPYEEQDSSEIGDYTVARFNPEHVSWRACSYCTSRSVSIATRSCICR